MSAPIASVELSRRLTRVNIAYTVARMQVIAARTGDPAAIAIQHVDGVAALMSRAVPSPNFNQVIGLREGQEDLVGTLDDWYREHKMKGRFVMAPGDFTPALGSALAARGYAQSEFDTVLYAPPPAPELPVSAAAISEVDSVEAMEQFLDALLTGWAIPRQHHDGAKANMRGWLGKPNWRLYLARVDGKPAAAAKLFVHDRIGYFADAATRPEFRARGLQTALLRHRAAVAAQLGVELIYSQAASGSASQRNMERIGLRVLHTRAIWTKCRVGKGA